MEPRYVREREMLISVLRSAQPNLRISNVFPPFFDPRICNNSQTKLAIRQDGRLAVRMTLQAAQSSSQGVITSKEVRTVLMLLITVVTKK